MSDLDIQIDVPDDDDLNSPVRVLNGGWMPPWLKAVAVLLVGAIAILVAAFLVGRSRSSDEPSLVPPTISSTSLSSVAATATIEQSLAAIEAWELFARSGDMAAIAESFDADGPQYEVFAESAAAGVTEELDFAARNLTEVVDDEFTIVSLDLIVSGPEGQDVYPYDLVYLTGSSRVWTVVDRRAPGTAVLPPPQAVVDAANLSWGLFTSSLQIGDGVGASDVVSEQTRLLAAEVFRASAGGTGLEATNTVLGEDPALFEVLVGQARLAGVDGPEDALLALFDVGQRQMLVRGELVAWTLLDPQRVIASLEVEGDYVATVPFVASAEGWTFDLVGALDTSGGTD